MIQTKPIAVFRFYASHWRGAGHAMRCMTLAHALKKNGWDCRFATEQESYDFVPSLQEFDRLDPDKFYNNPFPHDLLVVDHYEYSYDYETHFRSFAGLIFAIDDLADRAHNCDIILDQAFGRTTDDYKNHVPDNCNILVGPAHALLREQFYQLREESLNRRRQIKKIDRILINFGGNDQKNMILESLRALFDIGYVGKIDVVFGLMAPHRASVERYAAIMSNDITLYESPDMAALMCSADFAIGAPAVTAWERFCLGLPTLLLMTADNQSFTHGELVKDGLALGGTLDHLGQNGFIINFDKNMYTSLVDKCASQSDGSSASKIVSLIERKLDLHDTVQKKVS